MVYLQIFTDVEMNFQNLTCMKTNGEICLNVLKGNVTLDDKTLRELKRKKWIIRDLRIQTSLQRKRKIIKQHGGFLGTVVAIALPIITELLLKQK